MQKPEGIVQQMHTSKLRSQSSVAAALIFSLLVRCFIGLHSYSGRHDPPQFGDYEAQRHWMELTVNLPVQDWYRNTNDNSLGYWGIDYPPLTAYQSWLCGKVIRFLEPDSMSLHTSRGYETISSKLWMRLSVIFFDISVFFPCVLAAVYAFNKSATRCKQLWILAVVLLQPAALLIDHGHFQYNNISLGLAAGAAAAIAAERRLLGSCLFCLALNHKQMSMYYAPAFFAHLLGWALQHKTKYQKATAVAKLAATVAATFAVVWWPYLGSAESLSGVFTRLVPLQRGLFEDYVANFWCVSSLAIKWKRLFSQQALVKMTMGLTSLGLLPSMLQQILRPSSIGLLYGMANSAFAFFLFSYQVHEKSVLLAVLPVGLLAGEEPLVPRWLPAVAAFSIFPLLQRDGLPLAYTALLLLWAALALPTTPPQRGRWRQVQAVVLGGSVALAAVIHLSAAAFQPPARLPFLFDALFVAFSFVHLAIMALYLNWRQWQVQDLVTTLH